MIAAGEIPKPAFNAFKLMHELGDERIDIKSDSALVTRKQNGALEVAVWNYSPPEAAGVEKSVTLRFENFGPKQASISMLDAADGDSQTAYLKMGSPRYPTQAQILALRQAAELPPPSTHPVTGKQLSLTLPPHALALVELK